MRPRALVLMALILLTFSGWAFGERKHVIVFGDSLTASGVMSGCWIELLQRRFPNMLFEASGVPGEPSGKLRVRLAKALIYERPDVVLIFTGLNNILEKPFSALAFENDLNAMIEACYRCPSQPKVILMTPGLQGERHPGENPKDKEIDAIAKVVRDQAAAHNLTLIDTRKAFQQNPNPTNVYEGLLTFDGTHLTSKGQRLLYETALQKLR